MYCRLFTKGIVEDWLTEFDTTSTFVAQVENVECTNKRLQGNKHATYSTSMCVACSKAKNQMINGSSTCSLL